MKTILRSAIDNFGRWTGIQHLPQLERASCVLDFYAFRRAHADTPLFTHRFDLYKHLQSSVIADNPITYLEFGVYQGDSFRKWMELNQHPDSSFTGFDTFEGLPETWDMGGGQIRSKGSFDVNGRTPSCDDPRGSFIVGVFQATLLPFLASNWHPHKQIVVHMDADLYSSTLFCLAQLYQWLPAGTIIIFDELVNSIHEYRALIDWSHSHLVDFEVLGATHRFEQTAIRITRKRLHYREETPTT